jgi:hypothetical protein
MLTHLKTLDYLNPFKDMLKYIIKEKQTIKNTIKALDYQITKEDLMTCLDGFNKMTGD